MAKLAWVAGVVCGVPLLAYVAFRFWYLSKPGLRSLLFFRPCRLLAKETLVEAAQGRFPVRRFTFSLPDGALDLGVDLALGEHVKVHKSA